ncbi:MAG: glycosyltransferase family 2 protein [Leptospiraceae bacterium]|nr:glycosyltransferase family 2 protein [Leptospiraceae bacterium]
MSLERKNGFIIIPALNEEDSLPIVLNDLIEYSFVKKENVIVVDNNSTDKTNEIAKSFGVTVLFEKNQGYGNACLKALSYIEEQVQKPDWIAFLDGDRSDFVSNLSIVLEPILNEKADFCVGSREVLEKGALSLPQIFGNKLVTSLIYFTYRKKFKDLGSMRVLNYKEFKKLSLQNKTWGWNIEMNLRAIQENLKILEVPVSYRKRFAGVSKISNDWKKILPVGFTILYTFFKIVISRKKNLIMIEYSTIIISIKKLEMFIRKITSLKKSEDMESEK